MSIMHVGQPTRRVEDGRFLTGLGRYVDDLELPGAVFAAFLRSPRAHAIIRRIDTGTARALPGVLAVLTGADWQAAGGGILPVITEVPFSDGRPMAEASRPVLATGRVRHVGDTLAVVIADTRDRAQDAVEAIEIEFDDLPVASTTAAALADDAPQLHDHCPGNLCFDWEAGDPAVVERALAGSAHRVDLTVENNRVFHLPIEPRAVAARYDAADDRYTLWTSTQIPHLIRNFLAEHSLKVPATRLRVISPDVGGGFGQKSIHYPEEPALLWASKIVGRPVRWHATRSESFLVDAHARDQTARVRMGLDAGGRITALAVDIVGNLGAYLSAFAAAVPSTFCCSMLSQCYAIPAIHARARGVYTNTTPTDAYRGAGQPESSYIVERAIDTAARDLGIDPLDLRERNLIPPFANGHETALGVTYDSGNYRGLFDIARETAGYAAMRTEQAAMQAAGRLVGIGIGAFVESGAGGTRTARGWGRSRLGQWDAASLRIHPDGRATLLVGSHSHGQGHATVFRQVLADRLGIAFDDIEIVFGDTDRVHAGVGTFYSRSLTIIGEASGIAVDKVISKGRKIAAHLLECADADVTFRDGAFEIAGTDRCLSFRAVAHAAYSGERMPRDLEPGLDESGYHDPASPTYSAGIHIAMLEIDRESGAITVHRHVAVDDCGRMVNPMIVEGQVHGGTAQGIGQALMEWSRYDEDGQLLTGSLMDYGPPRADDLPRFETASQETPAPGNALGVKGVGESGCIGAPSAIVNAAIDALSPLGVTSLDMPLTPPRIWEAIRRARPVSAT
jgi:carbon-monoxide dehydrogenase large subunit